MTTQTQTKFDEDSTAYAWLERWAIGSEALSESLMLRRRSLFDVEKGFDAKRRAAEAIERVQSVWHRCERVWGQEKLFSDKDRGGG